MSATALAPSPTILYKVQLEDEIPAIGSGTRWVFAREGRKWALVLCPFTANTVRLPIDVWRGIKRDRWGAGVCSKDYLRGRIRSMDRDPTAFEKSALASR